jgi:acyl-coenzyme A synthetase/AMP-(fatty) acid ligase
VTDVLVKGEKHSLLGQIVIASVALSEPEPLPELRARVRALCRAKLAEYKVPTKVLLMDADMYSARFKKIRK